MTQIKNKIVLFMVFFLCSLLVGCNDMLETNVSPVTKPKVVLNWTTEERPRFFYPSMDLSNIEKEVVVQMYEGLTRTIGEDVYYGMAEKIEVSNGRLIYDVHLKNAQWSDGKMITTDDFIYSWERADNYIDNVNLLYFDNFIQKVQVMDDKRMRIILSQKNDDLLKQLSKVEFMPLRRDVVDLNLPTPIFLSDVTNGPFTLASHDFIGGLKLTKNIHYYDYYNVYLDKININFRSDYVRSYQDFKAGEIDVLFNIDMAQYDNYLQNEADFKIFNKPGVYGFAMNHTKETLRDIRVRQLLNLCVDRSSVNPYNDIVHDTICYSIFDHKTIESLSKDELNFGFIGYENVLNPSKPYIETSKIAALMSEIDESVLQELNQITITTTNSKNDIKIATMIKESWEENLGISVRVSSEDRYDFAYIRNSKSYDIILDSKYYVDYTPRHMLKYFLTGTSLNHTSFSSEKYDKLVMKTIGNLDSNLFKLYETTISDVDDMALMIPLFNTQEPVLLSPELQGWTRTYESLFYFGRAHKKEAIN